MEHIKILLNQLLATARIWQTVTLTRRWGVGRHLSGDWFITLFLMFVYSSHTYFFGHLLVVTHSMLLSRCKINLLRHILTVNQSERRHDSTDQMPTSIDRGGCSWRHAIHAGIMYDCLVKFSQGHYNSFFVSAFVLYSPLSRSLTLAIYNNHYWYKDSVPSILIWLS